MNRETSEDNNWEEVLRVGVEWRLGSCGGIREVFEISKVRMIKQNWILKKTYENIN